MGRTQVADLCGVGEGCPGDRWSAVSLENSPIDCSYANYSVLGEPEKCAGHSVEVGSYPNGSSPYGALDMAGNTSEWIADWYAETDLSLLVPEDQNTQFFD